MNDRYQDLTAEQERAKNERVERARQSAVQQQWKGLLWGSILAASALCIYWWLV